MKIAIRADGGTKIGMGHIMRTLVLAKELSKTDEVFYICRADDLNIDKYRSGIERVKTQGFEVKVVPEESLLQSIKGIKADCLITDSYDVDENYFNEIKKIFKKTGYIDDLAAHYFNVDFIINQNINALDLKYKVNPGTALLLGSKYIMVRDEFRNIGIRNANDFVENILITVGGANLYGLTEKILGFIRNIRVNFHVVIGPSFNDIEIQRIKEHESTDVKLYYDANMCQLMSICDLAISACGSTLYELAACGVPTIGIVLAENQLNIAKKMDEIGFIKNMGWYNSFDKSTLTNLISELISSKDIRLSMSKRGQELVDGNGAKNAAAAIHTIISK